MVGMTNFHKTPISTSPVMESANRPMKGGPYGEE